jgi:5-methyltetrahydrofolate--homocysteine methyltransferase
MIDSTDAAVLEVALRHCQGKAIVNSINLEDGEERFEKVAPCSVSTGARSWSAASTRTSSKAWR